MNKVIKQTQLNFKDKEIQQRIREHAYFLWKTDKTPKKTSKYYWELAAHIVKSELEEKSKLGKKSEDFNNSLEKRLVGIVISILGFVILMLTANLTFQYRNYNIGIELVKKTEKSNPENHAIVLNYSRAWDFAVVKTSTLFLAFMLIFLGTLYLLRIAETSYSLNVASPQNVKLDFSTTSPGLVLVTLG